MELKDLGFKGKKAEKLKSSGIANSHELLYKEPRKYMHMDKVTALGMTDEILSACEEKRPVVIYGLVDDVVLDRLPDKKLSVVKIKLIDHVTGQKLHIQFFGAKHLFDRYRAMMGAYAYAGGTIAHKVFKEHDQFFMQNPFLFTQDPDDLKIYPIYRKYSGISEGSYQKALQDSYEKIDHDYIPDSITHRYRLMPYKDTVRAIHFPDSDRQIQEARKRIIFDKILYFASKTASMNMQDDRTAYIPDKTEKTDRFIAELPFTLTDDQSGAIQTLLGSMRERRTSALIQGDVSCGKTIVAMALMLYFAENGFQSCLMAPTVILAKQHYDELSGYADKLGYSVAFLSSESSAADRKKIQREIKEKKHLLIVGTHSCVSKDVTYADLGLIITDEEHRFGVSQREAVREKSENVHMISMSATPIPRSLANTIYGAKTEIITIKQMPNGRKKVKTAITSDDAKITPFIQGQLDAGHQAYVVCPLIDEADDESTMSGISSIQAVSEKYKRYLPSARIGVITGKMDASEIEGIKRSFYDGDIDVLIATSIIEVGINVPNATVIVIESAERFGLATLHQLRGRVGRGTDQSYCILKRTSEDTESSNLEILQRETDGFEIAREDLKKRGPGSIFGLMQTGHSQLIELLITYPMLYKKVTEIAEDMSEEERRKYIMDFEERYPSCS